MTNKLQDIKHIKQQIKDRSDSFKKILLSKAVETKDLTDHLYIQTMTLVLANKIQEDKIDYNNDLIDCSSYNHNNKIGSVNFHKAKNMRKSTFKKQLDYIHIAQTFDYTKYYDIKINSLVFEKILKVTNKKLRFNLLLFGNIIYNKPTKEFTLGYKAFDYYIDSNKYYKTCKEWFIQENIIKQELYLGDGIEFKYSIGSSLVEKFSLNKTYIVPSIKKIGGKPGLFDAYVKRITKHSESLLKVDTIKSVLPNDPAFIYALLSFVNRDKIQGEKFDIVIAKNLQDFYNNYDTGDKLPFGSITFNKKSENQKTKIKKYLETKRIKLIKNNWILQIYNFQKIVYSNLDMKHKKDDFGYRNHSALTNLSKFLRNSLCDSNLDKLLEIDLSSAAFFCIAKSAKEFFDRGKLTCINKKDLDFQYDNFQKIYKKNIYADLGLFIAKKKKCFTNVKEAKKLALSFVFDDVNDTKLFFNKKNIVFEYFYHSFPFFVRYIQYVQQDKYNFKIDRYDNIIYKGYVKACSNAQKEEGKIIKKLLSFIDCDKDVLFTVHDAIFISKADLYKDREYKKKCAKNEKMQYYLSNAYIKMKRYLEEIGCGFSIE